MVFWQKVISDYNLKYTRKTKKKKIQGSATVSEKNTIYVILNAVMIWINILIYTCIIMKI